MKPNNRNLIKMEKMFEQGTTPETLYKLYGSTKKLRLQQEFREFYKWRISWRNQRAYPRPGLVKL
ncbi:hypothetical protein PHMEG_00014495 [Phytophthora megakarya]|uniref:Uncharacterized protein n=1 Tax=Phytophthora megakarya TaxID=4795 RepID=A0A225W668_9STRA|nr:hypothetical protein PHMEG_00014495 [Phytophthora megakarya]